LAFAVGIKVRSNHLMPKYFQAGFLGFLCVAAAGLGSLLLADAKSSAY
jgi:hypothetical protein